MFSLNLLPSAEIMAIKNILLIHQVFLIECLKCQYLLKQKYKRKQTNIESHSLSNSEAVKLHNVSISQNYIFAGASFRL